MDPILNSYGAVEVGSSAQIMLTVAALSLGKHACDLGESQFASVCAYA